MRDPQRIHPFMHVVPILHWNFDPIALSIGSFQLHWYGICWGIAFMAAEPSVRRRLALMDWTDVDVTTLVVYALLGAIVGIPLFLAVRRAYPAVDRLGKRQTWTE